MAFRAAYFRKRLSFNFQARTSRGVLREKDSWYIKVWDEASPSIFGIGECSPLPKLSPDYRPELEGVIQTVIQSLTGLMSYTQSDISGIIRNMVPEGYPSIVFAVETALLDLLHGGRRIIFQNDFIKQKHIPINGLVWMGDMDQMLQQATTKIADGFTCIKMKVGGLNFEKECDILQYIRKKYFRDQITIRLDANGAFKSDDVLYKLEALARYDIHSIEQPIKPGLPEMEELCRKSPIPVVFDEELIGVTNSKAKKDLLARLKPQFIVLKPTLHGGLTSCEEWIKLANEAGVGYWMTSALESNIGLNAICQFTANYPVEIPQGLGTGMLFEENVDSPLVSEKGEIYWKKNGEWEVEEFLKDKVR